MEMTGMEVFLGGTALTALGGWFSAVRGVSRSECRQCRGNVREELVREIGSLGEVNRQFQDQTSRQLGDLFRMVRGLVIHADISKEDQDRILNG